VDVRTQCLVECVCVCVCVCVCIYVSLCVCVCVYLCLSVCVSIISLGFDIFFKHSRPVLYPENED